MSSACCRVSPKVFGGKKIVKSSTKRTTHERSELFSLVFGSVIIIVLFIATAVAMASPEFSLFLGRLIP